MKSIEVSARTIEEAISAGLVKLGCSLADCKVEVLQEGAKGLFGFFGSKPATVRLTPLVLDELEMESLGIDLHSALRHEEPDRARNGSAPKREKAAPAKREAASQPQKEKARPEKSAKARPRKEAQETPDQAKKPEAIERFISAPLPVKEKAEAGTKRAEPQKPRPRRGKEPREQAKPEPREKEIVYAPVEPPENIVIHAPDTMEGIAQAFLLNVTERMGVKVQVDMRRNEEGHLLATMYGDTLGILIGRRGETLDALQYLTSLQINKGQEDYTRVTLDTENYRAKREEALVRLASRMASRAVKTGRKVSLEPMNPYERRILHASLQGNPGVSTHSEGDEPYRHVVVVPQK